MGLDAENDAVCIGIDRDGVLGFGGWLFSGGLGILAV